MVALIPLRWRIQYKLCSIMRSGLLENAPRSYATSCSPLATRSRDFSATRPPLAASETSRRVQDVYDGTSLLVRRRTILPGGPDHAVGCCNCQTWSHSDLPHPARATNYIVARRPSFAAAGPRAWNKLPPPLRRVYSAATFKRQLKTFLYNHTFNSHC